jgi:hypothetical protein
MDGFSALMVVTAVAMLGGAILFTVILGRGKKK